MTHDPTIRHWQIKNFIEFPNKYYIGLLTIRLINNKYETTIIRSNDRNIIPDLYIHFLNVNLNEKDAVTLHDLVKDKLFMLSKTIVPLSFEDLLDKIESNIPEINRYKESVPYQYPDDHNGEGYR
jgi:hypothetical protein